jgi:hypothetical protein
LKNGEKSKENKFEKPQMHLCPHMEKLKTIKLETFGNVGKSREVEKWKKFLQKNSLKSLKCMCADAYEKGGKGLLGQQGF